MIAHSKWGEPNRTWPIPIGGWPLVPAATCAIVRHVPKPHSVDTTLLDQRCLEWKCRTSLLPGDEREQRYVEIIACFTIARLVLRGIEESVEFSLDPRVQLSISILGASLAFVVYQIWPGMPSTYEELGNEVLPSFLVAG